MARTRVFLTGGDNMGWALDEDYARTKEVLQKLPDLIELTSLGEAKVVHTVWPRVLLDLGKGELAGKRVISHMPNQPYELCREIAFPQYLQRTSLWISQSRQAARQLESLKLKHFFIPYIQDSSQLHRRPPPKRFEKLLSALPRDRLIIGSFQRDSEGSNLNKPKLVKGPDILLAILLLLREKSVPFHVLLAGPRRHWIIRQFVDCRIPFSYIGEETSGDDVFINTLSREDVSTLYQFLDIYLITSRSEGGPRAVLEASAARVPVVAPPVGHVPDIISEICIYQTPDQAARIIDAHSREKILAQTLERNFQRVCSTHSCEGAKDLFSELYRNIIPQVPIFSGGTPTLSQGGAYNQARRKGRAFLRKLGMGFLSNSKKPERLHISLLNAFHRPPYGGGNQFFLALERALCEAGMRVSRNRLTEGVDLYILNALWFEMSEFEKFAARHRPTVLHRIDGPVSLIRGTCDRDADDECLRINGLHAGATVLQSAWNYSKLVEMGYSPVHPTVILNSVDESIFNPYGRIKYQPGRRVRLIASSWSDNPRKGGPIYKWLEDHLDWARYEFTFVGRAQESFSRLRHLPAMPSEKLAAQLREHDIYITASQSDPCSNAVLEALACGLPVLYLNDGGHPEIVGQGGLPFSRPEEIIEQLERLVESYEIYQSLIHVRSMREVAEDYLTAARQVRQLRN